MTGHVVTELGLVLGTIPYMSPEQAEGRELDARTDVFSLGCILYELAVGVRPFTGDTKGALLGALLRDTPARISQRRVDLPMEFDRIVRKCLVKDRERRYGSASELKRDLEMLAEDLAEAPQLPAMKFSDAQPPRVARPERRRSLGSERWRNLLFHAPDGLRDPSDATSNCDGCPNWRLPCAWHCNRRGARERARERGRTGGQHTRGLRKHATP